MLIIARISRNGRLTIPRAIREAAGLKAGDRIAFVRQGSRVLLQPLRATLLERRGSVPVAGPQDFAAVRRQVIARRTR
jgi:AbrB family looped-hinge helix DNA binding protein